MIRPDARAALMRWSGVFAPAALAGLGVWWALSAYGLTRLFGVALAGAAVVLTVMAVQRRLFYQGANGPGLVQIDEGVVRYLGPLTGGAVALRDLGRIDYDAASHPAHWRLVAPGEGALHIPVTAAGADSLLDAFVALPGLSAGDLLAAPRRAKGAVVTVWQRKASENPVATL